jgi:tetratricopeptide (TPR) repeat protein
MTCDEELTLIERISKEHFLGPVIDELGFENFDSDLGEKLNRLLAEADTNQDRLTFIFANFLSFHCELCQIDENKEKILDYMLSLDVSSLDTLSLLMLSLISVIFCLEELSLQYIDLCKKSLNFEYSTSGYLGFKSRHQEKPVAILLVDVIKSTALETNKPHGLLPKNVELIDDDLYNSPKVEDYDPIQVGEEECVLLLINALFVDKFETRDDASAEKIDAYVSKVIESTRSWSIRRMALYLRSLNEYRRPKFMARSMRQLESLFNEVYESVPSASDRFKNFEISCMPDLRTLTKELASAYVRNGEYLHAAKMLQAVNIHDQAAVCLVNGGRNEEAVKLLRTELERHPQNFSCLCLLGSLTSDDLCFRGAWELSGNSYFPALRALGLSLYNQNMMQDSCDCFSHLTSRFPSNPDYWFLLGCSFLRLQNWKGALETFNRVVSLNSDHFQAWNNLAAIHIQMGKFDLAQNALKICVMHEFDSWKIWENLFRVSLQLGDLFECVLAYQRLIELRGRDAGLHPFLLLIERISDASSEVSHSQKIHSLFKILDCLLSRLDILFDNNSGYLWMKSEYDKQKSGSLALSNLDNSARVS